MATTSLFVGNLPLRVSQQKIQELFASYNPVLIGYVSGRSFAFVEVASTSVDAAVHDLDGVVVDGHRLRVKVADFSELGTSERS